MTMEPHDDCRFVSCPYFSDDFCQDCDPCLAKALASLSTLREQRDRDAKAIRDFLAGYDRAAPDVQAIYQIAAAHGFQYTGYQYTAELEALRALSSQAGRTGE